MEINEATQPLYVMATNGKRYTFFWMNRPLPENITTHTLEQAFLQANPHFPSANKMNEFCRGEWFPHNEDCFGYSYEVEVALTDSVESCALSMGIAKYDTTLSERGWCVVGTCEPGKEPYYSSSSYAGSSSSEESSSSSEFGLCQSLPFGYIPSDPKSTCFESNGKCYRCNAARRADECDEEWMWIYPYTPDKYFFTEIDCISGERKDNNRIGQCPGFPMETTPYNPEQACIAHNGKCYRCKSENSYVNCSHNWLWTGENFGTHNIGLWYKEVDCDEPFEEDNLVCPDGSVLYRKTADSENLYFNEKLEENQKFQIKYFYFDALGRSMKKKNVSRVKQIPYVKSRLNRDTSIELTSGSMFNVLLKTVNGHISALTSATFIYSTECSNEDYVPLNITIILSTPEDGIKVYLEGNDDDLKNHEQKHKSIYIEYGNDSWIESTTIPRRMTMKSVCEKIKNDYWVSIESKFRIMLNLQNAWDDEDENNVSHERIDVNREVENLKKQWLNSKCKETVE